MRRKKKDRSWFRCIENKVRVRVCGMFYEKGKKTINFWLLILFLALSANCLLPVCLVSLRCEAWENSWQGGVNAWKDTSALPLYLLLSGSSRSCSVLLLQMQSRQLRQSSIKQKGRKTSIARKISSGSPGLDTRNKNYDDEPAGGGSRIDQKVSTTIAPPLPSYDTFPCLTTPVVK